MGEEALRRLRAFAAAGADILFLEGFESEEQMEVVGKEFPDHILMVNVVEGGKTPTLSKERYAELGFQFAIYPATGFLSMAKALEKSYTELKKFGSSKGCKED